jgi:transposase
LLRYIADAGRAHDRLDRRLSEFMGLRRDGEAVMAALSSQWSNGQTEGQINRLKMLKRQMYGRANFDLLRARVLHTAQA